jgi:predicted O-methyltransferase YrrM
MNIENALKIQGWMEEADLRWLAEKASTRKHIVEVGCWRGRSTTVLADNTPGTVFAVDHFQGSEEHQPVDAPKLRRMFAEQMAEYIRASKVLVLDLPSVVAAAHCAKVYKSFDMIFIDAFHDYESIKADLDAWAPLVSPGGLLCGHDVGHPPVERAVWEKFPQAQRAFCLWYVEFP